jgi:energy-coupling factor transporter ATP-binding protein EcfA2
MTPSNNRSRRWLFRRGASPAVNAEATPPEVDVKPIHTAPLPVVWLLGKTGSGKSFLIRAMTGLSDVEIGNGFMPCTKTARRFDFPAEIPVMRFIDTRGLGEVSYDPTKDLAAAESGSHVIIVFARLDDPV